MQLLRAINGVVWGLPALLLILGVGIYLSIYTRFAQLRLFGKAVRLFVRKLRPSSNQNGVTPFQALCTALAATVGTGNIAGVAGAIALGGPGAVFWMWISAILGMIIKCAEATLAVYYRRPTRNGDWVGGTMHTIRYGLGGEWKWLSAVYAFLGVVAAFGVGNATQISAVIDSVDSAAFSLGVVLPAYIDYGIGIVLSVLVMVILLGGAKRIGLCTERLIPFAAVAYILLCLTIIALHASMLPQVLRAIIGGAFNPQAVTGGVIGSLLVSLRTGVSRGVFTNEAGMGTAAIAHASAAVSHPTEQGMMGIMEVFIDTILICTMTALAILCSGMPISYGVDEGAALTSRAFSTSLGPYAAVVLAAFLCLFAFATMVGWGFYGIRCAQYLFGEKVLTGVVILQAIVTMLSVSMQTATIWLLAEVFNGLMAVPNLIALWMLAPNFMKILNEFRYTGGTETADGGTYENFNQCKPL